MRYYRVVANVRNNRNTCQGQNPIQVHRFRKFGVSFSVHDPARSDIYASTLTVRLQGCF